MTNSIRNSGPSNAYLPPSNPHAGPSRSRSAPTLSADVLLKMQKQAAKDGLESLQKYKTAFKANGEQQALSHGERIKKATEAVDLGRDFSQLEACWQNNNKGSIRKIVVDLMGAARLTGIGVNTVPDLTSDQFKKLNELSGKPDHLLSKGQRKELIKLSAHALLKEKIFGVEFNELSGKAGTDALKKMYVDKHVPASDTSLTARMGTVFAQLDKINHHKSVLDDIKREPIRSTLTVMRNRLASAASSASATPRNPTPLTSTTTTGRNLKSKIREAVVGKEDFGYNGFGKKADSTHGIAKPDPTPGPLETAGSRNGGKMLQHAFTKGGLRGGVSEAARQARRQWAKGGSPSGADASHGYVNHPDMSNLNQRLNALVREQAESAGRPPDPEKDLPPLPDSKTQVEGDESSTQPPPVPPKDSPMPSAATGPAARVASSSVRKAPALEVDQSTAVAMTHTPDIHDMYDPANKEKLALAAKVAGPKASKGQVEATYKELVAEKPMDDLLDASRALLNKLSK